MTETKAKVFWSGRSQAVRLPKEFRFETSEVLIRREGNTVVLEQAPTEESEDAWIDRVVGRFSEEGLRAIEQDRPGHQERPELDDLFK
jgi:antitoxin VapB